MLFRNSTDFSRKLDQDFEPITRRDDFIFPVFNNEKAIYFLGNSLGLQPVKTEKYISDILMQWKGYGVEGFFQGKEPWIDYHDHLASLLSPIVGAKPCEIVVMNQLTVNLHLMLASFYRPHDKRIKIICEAKAFPSDQYAMESHILLRGLDPSKIIVEVFPKNGKQLIDHEDILDAIEQHKEELALVLWGGVNYYSGQVFNIQSISRAAHEAGALAGFDLAHAAGNIPLYLHDWNVDFACWCSYKYLNSGPGAIAASFIHERFHRDLSIQRLAGWWGFNKEKRFLMQKEFEPSCSAEGWQLSTPSPVLYAMQKAALEITHSAGIENLNSKGQIMSDYVQFLINEINAEFSGNLIKILTPGNHMEKGCQVSLIIPKYGKNVFEYLSRQGIFADWREPDVIRIAPVPLYNTFGEIWKFGQIMQMAIKSAIQ